MPNWWKPIRVTRYWRKVLLRDPCPYCGAASTTIDHVIPRFWGGTSHAENIVGACRECNGQKGSTKMLVYLIVKQQAERNGRPYADELRDIWDKWKAQKQTA